MKPAKDGGYIWTTKEGKVMSTKEMTTQHIKYAINYLKRVGFRYFGPVVDFKKDTVVGFYNGPDKAMDEKKIKILEEELKLRGEL